MQLAAARAKVVVSSRSHDELDEVVQCIRLAGGLAEAVVCDFSNRSHSCQLIADAQIESDSPLPALESRTAAYAAAALGVNHHGRLDQRTDSVAGSGMRGRRHHGQLHPASTVGSCGTVESGHCAWAIERSCGLCMDGDHGPGFNQRTTPLLRGRQLPCVAQ